MFRPLITVALLTAFGLTGCFEEADTTLSPCEQMVDALCQAACGCSDLDCYYFQEAFFAEYDAEAACVAEETSLHCGDSGATGDWGACEDALAGASCGEDNGSPGLVLPDACGDLVTY